MSATVYRQVCGTRWGISTHVEKGEEPCGACLTADDARKAAHEARQPLVIPESGAIHDLRQLIGVLAEALAERDRATYRRTYRSAS